MAACAREHADQPDGGRTVTHQNSCRLLCGKCRDRLRTDLISLSSLYEDCSHVISQETQGRSLERVSGSRAVDTLNISAIEIRHSIRGVLASWARVIAEGRQVAPPQRKVGSLSRFLVAHLDWLTAHPGAVGFADQVADLVVGADRALSHTSEEGRTFELGECVEPGCRGTVVAHAEPDRATPSRLRCEAGHEWGARDWLVLGNHLRR